MSRPFAIATLAVLLCSPVACDKGTDTAKSESADEAAKSDDAKKDDEAKEAADGADAADAKAIEPPPPAEPPADTWIDFESKEGRFTAKFPVAPRTEKSQVPTAGMMVEMVTYGAEVGDTYFAVATADYPEEMVKASEPAKLLDGARDGAVANINGKLAEEKQIELDGNPARRIKVTADVQGTSLVLEGVLCLVDNRLYQVMVAHMASADVEADVTKFIDSLHPAKE